MILLAQANTYFKPRVNVGGDCARPLIQKGMDKWEAITSTNPPCYKPEI